MPPSPGYCCPTIDVRLVMKKSYCLVEGMVVLEGRVVNTTHVVHGAGQLYETRQTSSVEGEGKPEIALLNLPNPFEFVDKNVAPMSWLLQIT